ncbi:MAG: RlmE family RNA methyltransferase [Deltaproteobacteria bacterium]|nr:RlmE family RNA methyltransferase [Deltaproteobacteria bacterium]
MTHSGRKIKDHYFYQAKREGFPARSVYKLKEIDQRHRLFKPGDAVLDLGASPGSWLQFVGQAVGRNGHITGVDLKPLSGPVPANARFIMADIFTLGLEELAPPAGGFDVVLSDMAPQTTGIKITDATRSYELAHTALMVSLKHLKEGGHFVAKIFQGPDFPNFLAEVKKAYRTVKAFKPDSTRRESKEVFVVALEKKRLTE